jgi:hypothetical protein
MNRQTKSEGLKSITQSLHNNWQQAATPSFNQIPLQGTRGYTWGNTWDKLAETTYFKRCNPPTWPILEGRLPCYYISCAQSNPWACWPVSTLQKYHGITYNHTSIVVSTKLHRSPDKYLSLILMLLSWRHVCGVNCSRTRLIASPNKGTIHQLEGRHIAGSTNLGRRKHREQPFLLLRSPRRSIAHLRS